MRISKEMKPVSIIIHKNSKIIEISFDDDSKFMLTFEFLRVNSPSAEVKGHGPGQEVLQVEKQNVDILSIEQVGNYAIKPTFSDGHDTGLFSWNYLYEICINKEKIWDKYLKKLKKDGKKR
tara:strand:+ start:64 stop:426 length:363 start_codon:yes stop_codon:yes gene_type:complete